MYTIYKSNKSYISPYSVSCRKVINGVKVFAMHQDTDHSPIKHTPSRFMLQAANGAGNAISLHLAIRAFWKPSHLSGNFRHETPDAYAAYRTCIWSGSVDCTGVVKYESSVLYTFVFISLE
jgi:hypothetical protein